MYDVPFTPARAPPPAARSLFVLVLDFGGWWLVVGCWLLVVGYCLLLVLLPWLLLLASRAAIRVHQRGIPIGSDAEFQSCDTSD